MVVLVVVERGIYMPYKVAVVVVDGGGGVSGGGKRNIHVL